MKQILQLIVVIMLLAILGMVAYQWISHVPPQLTAEQMQMRLVAQRNAHLRWQVFWWMFTAGLSLAALGGGYYVVVLAKNQRERIYADPVTGLWPITREDRAPWWERMRGNHDWIEEDPNLAMAPTRRIHANGKLTVQADMHGVPVEQQMEYAAKSWTVQRAIASATGGLRPNSAMLKDAAGVYDAEARRKNLLADRAEQRALPVTGGTVDAEYRVMQTPFAEALHQSTKTNFVLGQSAAGEIVRWDVETTPHIRVHGKTQGSGKTNLIKQVALCAVRSGHHVIVLDRRMFKDWHPYRRHVELVDNRKPGAFMATVTTIREIYQHRDVRLGAAGAENIEALGGKVQRIFVVISEFGSAIRELAEEDRLIIVAVLKTIISEAGATGVHLIMEDQTNSKWPREIRGNAEPITGYLPEDTSAAGGYRKAHELKAYEFHHDGERFRTWDMKAEAPALLMNTPPDDEVLVDMMSAAAQRPVVPVPVPAEKNDFLDNLTPGKNNFVGNGNGNDEKSNKWADFVDQWNADNPEGGPSALARAMADADGNIKPYQDYKSEAARRLDALRSKMTGTSIADQLRAQGVDLASVRLPGGEKIGTDITYTAIGE